MQHYVGILDTVFAFLFSWQSREHLIVCYMSRQVFNTSSLYIPETSPLSNMTPKYFILFCVLSFHFLKECPFNFSLNMKSSLSIILLCCCLRLSCHNKKSFLSPKVINM